MKKTLILCALSMLIMPFAQANVLEKSDYLKIQDIGTKILVSNNIQQKFIFGISETTNDSMLPIANDTSLLNDYDLHNNRNVTIPKENYYRVTSNDEIAGLLAHNIAQGVHSYTGVLNGQLMFTKNGPCPFNYFAKKNEMEFDKTAVDYLVKAGYNPTAIITAYSKTLPEVRGTFFSRHNKAQKRMNNVYQYIKIKYPKYLSTNNSIQYQRFLKAKSL